MNDAISAFKTASGVSTGSLNALITMFLFGVLCLVAAYIFKEQIKELSSGTSFNDGLRLFIRVCVLVCIVSIFLLQ